MRAYVIFSVVLPKSLLKRVINSTRARHLLLMACFTHRVRQGIQPTNSLVCRSQATCSREKNLIPSRDRAVGVLFPYVGTVQGFVLGLCPVHGLSVL